MIYLMRIQGFCAVCGKAFEADELGQGRCGNCKWVNDAMSEQNPDRVGLPNLIPLIRRKVILGK